MDSPIEKCSTPEELLGRFNPKLFKALADPTRLRLLLRLARNPWACCVNDLAVEEPIDVSVVSRHLGILRDAGVIECTRKGKEVHCSVRTVELARFFRELADALEGCCPNGCNFVVATDEDRRVDAGKE